MIKIHIVVAAEVLFFYDPNLWDGFSLEER
jgi:hypothetical protein